MTFFDDKCRKLWTGGLLSVHTGRFVGNCSDWHVGWTNTFVGRQKKNVGDMNTGSSKTPQQLTPIWRRDMAPTKKIVGDMSGRQIGVNCCGLTNRIDMAPTKISVGGMSIRFICPILPRQIDQCEQCLIHAPTALICADFVEPRNHSSALTHSIVNERDLMLNLTKWLT